MQASVPLVDLGPWLEGTAEGRAAVAARIDEALQDSGFLLITGHGVPRELRTATRELARRFFALPEATKAKYTVSVGGRGWLPPGVEANGYAEGTETPPDLKESYSAGADAAAVTSMGGHFCIRELEAISPLPILNALPEVDAAIRHRNLKTIGILGTRTVMETRLYGGISSARFVLPEGEALEQVHKNYIEMAIAGRVTEAQRRTFFSVGQHLCRAQDAEAVVLGGTDLFLAFEGQDCGFPVIDCADVHIEAIYQRSVGKA